MNSIQLTHCQQNKNSKLKSTILKKNHQTFQMSLHYLRQCTLMSMEVPEYLNNLNYMQVYVSFLYFIFQAIYNVLVTALFCILAWAVYYVVLIVLEPFLVPLFWVRIVS